ncbi:MAG: TrkH family potassium uptake protein [Bacteroidaceae bacterium]|nr:TrkH family potassium uptake protein [Bacteroidaceae bacterium]
MKKRIFGILLQLESVFLILTSLVSLMYKEKDWWMFMMCAIISFSIGAITISISKWQSKRNKIEKYLSRADSFMVVALTWVLFSLIGMIPFIKLEGMSITDAFFETMSGFTTTGASVISDIDGIGYGLKFWRSIIQWMGGLGIVVFTFALVPTGEMRNNNIFSAEATGISLDKFSPKIGSTARRLLAIYIILTAMCAGLYYIGPMNLFDSICHALTTTATGGFSTHTASIAYFNSPYIEYVCAIFMLLSSLNFGMYYYAFIKRWDIIKSNEELNIFLKIVCFAVVIFILLFNFSSYTMDNILSLPVGIEEEFRSALFHVATIISSSGFAATKFDYVAWGDAYIMPTILLMIIGACAGSTSGGIKVVRFIVCMKSIRNEFLKQLHPRAILSVYLGGRIVSNERVRRTLSFMIIYMALVIIGITIMSYFGMNTITGFGSTVSALSNIGPGAGLTGPANNYADIHPIAKWLMSFYMLVGRLEIYTVLFLFMPSLYKK